MSRGVHILQVAPPILEPSKFVKLFDRGTIALYKQYVNVIFYLQLTIGIRCLAETQTSIYLVEIVAPWNVSNRFCTFVKADSRQVGFYVTNYSKFYKIPF